MNIKDIITESKHACPNCGGPVVEYSELTEKKDACYYKVKASAKVWPSAYASGRLVQCRKKGAANYGNKSEGVSEAQLDEKCWDTHKQVGMKNKGGRQVPNCVPKESVTEGWGLAGGLVGGAIGTMTGDPAGILGGAAAGAALGHGIGNIGKDINRKSQEKAEKADRAFQERLERDPELKKFTESYDKWMDYFHKLWVHYDKKLPGIEGNELYGLYMDYLNIIHKVVWDSPGEYDERIDSLKNIISEFKDEAGNKEPDMPTESINQSVTKGDNSSQVGFDARFIEEPVTYPMVNVENSHTRRMEQKMATVVGPAEDGSFKVSLKENPRPGANSGSDWLPINSEGIGLNLITDTGPRTFGPARWCLEAIKKHKEELYGKQGGLHEQFDIIEEMVESLAEEHGVDADVIWEDFESVDDSELLETAAWRRKEGKSKKGGLNAKGVASYRRENPGSKLQTAVTTKPSKLKPGSKAAKRRKSFCARMGGVKGPMKKPNGKPTRKALALRKWNC